MATDNVIIYAGIAAVFGVIKAKMKDQTKSVTSYVFSIFISICFAVLVGFTAEEFNIPQGVVFTLVAAAALTAEGLATMIIGIGDAAGKDPFGTIKKLRGK